MTAIRMLRRVFREAEAEHHDSELLPVMNAVRRAQSLGGEVELAAAYRMLALVRDRVRSGEALAAFVPELVQRDHDVEARSGLSLGRGRARVREGIVLV